MNFLQSPVISREFPVGREITGNHGVPPGGGGPLRRSFCPVEGTQCTVIICNEFVQRVQDLQIENLLKFRKWKLEGKVMLGVVIRNFVSDA